MSSILKLKNLKNFVRFSIKATPPSKNLPSYIGYQYFIKIKNECMHLSNNSAFRIFFSLSDMRNICTFIHLTGGKILELT